MPWNTQGGGGPWGQPPGGNNPWGRPPGGGPNRPPPDLDDLIRQGQEQFKQMFPEGFTSGPGLGIMLALLACLYVYLCAYRVEPDERGVVLRFGAYSHTADPGLQFMIWPIDEVYKPPVTSIRAIEVGFRTRGATPTRLGATRRGNENVEAVPDESLMVTGDENIIDIHFVVTWQIDPARPENYLFNIRNPDETIKKVAESVMREVVGQTTLEAALTIERDRIEDRTRGLVQDLLDQYEVGVLIQQVDLQKVDPPEQVIEAFQDVIKAGQDRERSIEQANRHRNTVVPAARGEARQLVEEANAYRAEVVARAQGDAGRFDQVLAAFQNAEDVTARRLYLETMEAILRDTPKIIIESGAGEGVVPYLPLNELQRTRGENAAGGGR